MSTAEFQTLLVTGGARSGKSRYAQHWAESRSGALVFIATAQAFDTEMEDRIARHRCDRGPRWSTVEEPFDLAAAIDLHARPDAVVLVDCLTLWASNLILQDRDPYPPLAELARAIGAARGPLALVTNEVGMGIVPDNSLGRSFRDVAGHVNQAVAAACESVVLMVSGIPVTIK